MTDDLSKTARYAAIAREMAWQNMVAIVAGCLFVVGALIGLQCVLSSRAQPVSPPPRRAPVPVVVAPMPIPVAAPVPPPAPVREPPTPAEINERAQRSVVVIAQVSADGKRGWRGTGFFADGFVVTAYHVVDEDGPIMVRSADGVVAPATLVAGDKANDVALLSVPESCRLPSLPLAPEIPKVGSPAYTIGHPEKGFDFGFFTGVINGAHGDLIQTSVQSLHGSSGGPLLNATGEVIGVVSFGPPEHADFTFATSVAPVRILFRDLRGGRASIPKRPPSRAPAPPEPQPLRPTVRDEITAMIGDAALRYRNYALRRNVSGLKVVLLEDNRAMVWDVFEGRTSGMYAEARTIHLNSEERRLRLKPLLLFHTGRPSSPFSIERETLVTIRGDTLQYEGKTLAYEAGSRSGVQSALRLLLDE